jgi:hypothetical protein
MEKIKRIVLPKMYNVFVGVDTCHKDFDAIDDKEMFSKVVRSGVTSTLMGWFKVIDSVGVIQHVCGCYNFGIYIMPHEDVDYYRVIKHVDFIMSAFSHVKYNINSVWTSDKLPFVPAALGCDNVTYHNPTQ